MHRIIIISSSSNNNRTELDDKWWGIEIEYVEYFCWLPIVLWTIFNLMNDLSVACLTVRKIRRHWYYTTHFGIYKRICLHRSGQHQDIYVRIYTYVRTTVFTKGLVYTSMILFRFLMNKNFLLISWESIQWSFRIFFALFFFVWSCYSTVKGLLIILYNQIRENKSKKRERERETHEKKRARKANRWSELFSAFSHRKFFLRDCSFLFLSFFYFD